MIRPFSAVLLLSLGTYAKADAPLAPPGPWRNPPKLGAPKGQVVRVRSEEQLQEALSKLRSHTTVLIDPGIYDLSRTLQIGGGVKDVVVRGAGDDRNVVIIKGRGMRQ